MISINKKILFLIISVIFLSGGIAYAAINNNLKIPFIKTDKTKNIVFKNEEKSQLDSIKTEEEVKFVPTVTPSPTLASKVTSSSKSTTSPKQTDNTSSNNNKEVNKNEIDQNLKEKEDKKIENKIESNEINRGGSFQYIASELVLSLSKEGNSVRLNWTRCNSNTFNSYKVVRSKTNPNLYYPNNDPIYSTGNQEELSFLDQNTEAGVTYYYRVCSYESNGESWCGNVANITL